NANGVFMIGINTGSCTIASQSLIGLDDREYGVIETKENITVWFDITEIKKTLDNKLLFE
ncbi:hypothetical protein, partial [Kaarinaea lacus]